MFPRLRSRLPQPRHVVALLGAAAIAWAGAPAATREVAGGSVNAAPAQTPVKDTTALRRAALPGPYPAEIVSVLDGDTFEARVRIWFGQEITTLVRIRGIDAPELKGRCGDELRGAQASRDALAKLYHRLSASTHVGPLAHAD